MSEKFSAVERVSLESDELTALRQEVLDLRRKNKIMIAALSKIAYFGKRFHVFTEKKVMREIARQAIHEASQ